MRIGIRNNNMVAEDWCCFDNFTLRCKGNSTGIQSVENNGPKKLYDAIYDLQGRKVKSEKTDLNNEGTTKSEKTITNSRGTLAKGLYIMNGKKIIVK